MVIKDIHGLQHIMFSHRDIRTDSSASERKATSINRWCHTPTANKQQTSYTLYMRHCGQSLGVCGRPQNVTLPLPKKVVMTTETDTLWNGHHAPEDLSVPGLCERRPLSPSAWVKLTTTTFSAATSQKRVGDDDDAEKTKGQRRPIFCQPLPGPEALHVWVNSGGGAGYSQLDHAERANLPG